MNKRDLILARNASLQLLDYSQKRPVNAIRVNPGNSYEHELAKFNECWHLAEEGKQFVTEAVFFNGKRADIFVLDTSEVIEICRSEELAACSKKIADYPVKSDKVRMVKVLNEADFVQ